MPMGGDVDFASVKCVSFSYVEWGGRPRTYDLRVA
jgi:hypothetical protein